jgi:hypothetical protein
MPDTDHLPKKYSAPTGFLQGLLWTLALCDFARLLSSWMQWNLLQSVPFTRETAKANDAREQAIAMIF